MTAEWREAVVALLDEWEIAVSALVRREPGPFEQLHVKPIRYLYICQGRVG